MNPDAYSRSQKVITESVRALSALQNIDPVFWNDLCTRIRERKGKVLLTGVGKSGYVAMKIAATLTSLGHFATFVHPVEAMHGDAGCVQSGDIVMAFSFSGNTKELVQFLRHVRDMTDICVVGVTGNTESNLARLSDIVLTVPVVEEGSPHNLAPMASTTTMLVLGDALAAGITSPKFTKMDFARFHPSGTLGFSLTAVHEKMLPHSAEDMVLEDTPLQQVLHRMSEIGKGLIGVVTDEGILKGAITDGDIRRFLLTNTSTVGICARDIMNATPKCVERDHTLKDALDLMESLKITNVFVVEGGGVPVGILHMHDILSS